MDPAAQLTNAEVASLLFKFMTEKGPVGLNAVKFFLGTRTEEFREKANVKVTVASPEELSTAIRGIYGIGLLSLEAPDDVESPLDALPPPPATSEADLDLDELLQAPQTPSRPVPELPEEF